jgi:hypothetical protein
LEQARGSPVLGVTLDYQLAAHCGDAHPHIAAACGGNSPQLLALAAALLGRDTLTNDAISKATGDTDGESQPTMTQIIQQAHFKPPGSRCAFLWHQDSVFRRFHYGDFVDVNGRGSYCNIAIAIDAEFAPVDASGVPRGFGPVGHNGLGLFRLQFPEVLTFAYFYSICWISGSFL